MYPALKAEMFHGRKHLAERIGNLCHGGDSPVKVTAFDDYAKGIHLLPMGIDRHINFLVRETESGTVESEVLCSVHKLQKAWDGKRQLVEEVDLELLEARGGDPKNNRFQVSTNTVKLEMAKVRKCDDGRVRELPFYIALGDRKFEVDCELLQVGHE